MVKTTFKDKNITVLPIQGNHDTWVVDQEAFLEPESNYVINDLKSVWAEWLDD